MADDNKVVSFAEAFEEAVKDDEPVKDTPPGEAAVQAAALPASAATNDEFHVPDAEADKKAAEEKAAADKVAADAKAAEEKAAADKLVADKAAADAKAAEEKAAADKAAADAVAAKKIADDKAAADAAAAADPTKAAADVAAKAAADRVAKEAADIAKEAADKAAADAAVAKKIADDKAAADAAAAAKKAQEDEAALQASFEKPLELSEDDKKALATLEKEWGDEVVPGVKVLLKQQQYVLEQRFGKALFELGRQMVAAVQPIAQAHQMTAEERHFATIRSAHEDFDAVLPQVEKWVEQQPAYLKEAMNKTLDGGTAADVVDLVARYKKEAGVAAPAASAPAAAPAASAAPTVDAAAAAAAAELAPVKSGSSAPKAVAGVDKNNFGEAWQTD